MSTDDAFYERDEAGSTTEDRSTLRAVLAHWKYWLLGVVALAIGIGTYVNPTSTAVLYYPFFFGGAAVMFWYAIHDIRTRDTPYA